MSSAELAQLDMLMGTERVSVEDMPLEAPVWHSKPLLRQQVAELPLEHEAGSESFLVAELEGRVKLSADTRRREEKRLAKKLKPRKKYTYRNGARKHWKTKQATKRRRWEKAWREAPLDRLIYGYPYPVDIRPDEWQRRVAPVYDGHAVGTLRVKNGGRGKLTIYNLQLVHRKTGEIVYNGLDHIIEDVQVPELAERVVQLTQPHKQVRPR